MHVLHFVLLLLVQGRSEQISLNAVYAAYPVPQAQQPVASGVQQPVVQQASPQVPQAVQLEQPVASGPPIPQAVQPVASAVQQPVVKMQGAPLAAVQQPPPAMTVAVQQAPPAMTVEVLGKVAQPVVNVASAMVTAVQTPQSAATAAADAAIVRANTAANVAATANAAVAILPTAVLPAAAALPAPVPAGRFWSSLPWFLQLLTGLTFAMVVKGCCIVGNVLVQISPFPQVLRWESRKCTGEADAAPYVSIAFGGCQWCFYGMFAWLVTNRSGFLILVQSNFLGALLGTYYVRTFYSNCRNEAALVTLQKYLSGVTSLALLQVCAMGVLPAERALFLTGLVSSFCSFIGATSVLVTVPAVIKTKDSRSIPGPFAIANFASSLVWSLCGYLLEDPLVMIPNLFSSFCSATSLGLKVYYPSDIFSSGAGKADELPLELEAPAKLQSLAKKASRKATEFTPLKLSASKCNKLSCETIVSDPSARLLEKIASFDSPPVCDASTRLHEKIASFDSPVPMPEPVAVGDGTGGTGGM